MQKFAISRPRRFAAIAVAAVLAPLAGTNCLAAEPVWDEIKPAIFGERTIYLGNPANIMLTTPYRSSDDREVPVEVSAKFSDGRTVRSVTVVIDENPMPVSAVFRFDDARSAVAVAANMRFNGPSPIRAIVETGDGKLYMSEAYVKTSGLGACASPPVSNPTEAFASMGQMTLKHSVAADQSSRNITQLTQTAQLKIKHPNLTGLQMDQITLQYIPARYISIIEVQQGEERVMTIESGIALSEDPQIRFDYRLNGSGTISVYVKDTDGTEFRQEFPAGTGS